MHHILIRQIEEARLDASNFLIYSIHHIWILVARLVVRLLYFLLTDDDLTKAKDDLRALMYILIEFKCKAENLSELNRFVDVNIGEQTLIKTYDRDITAKSVINHSTGSQYLSQLNND